MPLRSKFQNKFDILSRVHTNSKQEVTMKARSSFPQNCVSRPILLVLCITIVSAVADAQHYQQSNLVSDVSGTATQSDQNLVNPWGLTRSSTTPWWVADNGTGVSTIYNGSSGAPSSLVVTIPGTHGTATPTGIVFNGTTSFELTSGNPATFIFVTEDGTISGWNRNVDPTNAVIKADQSQQSVFKGATIGNVDGHPFLYVADFAQARVDVFDSNFNAVRTIGEAFQDRRVPRGFAPFNVQNIGGNLYVTFAKQDKEKHDDVPGAGFGFVDVFNTRGRLVQRLQHGAWLDAPWGVALAPSDFGAFSHNILVGQFGSGEIAGYDVVTGEFLGKVKDPNDAVLKIDGLWALSFGNGAASGPLNVLFFTAGIQDEKHGLFGTVTPVANELTAGNER
jgi:uncharacterized protein (TIGR03118 family)